MPRPGPDRLSRGLADALEPDRPHARRLAVLAHLHGHEDGRRRAPPASAEVDEGACTAITAPRMMNGITTTRVMAQSISNPRARGPQSASTPWGE